MSDYQHEPVLVDEVLSFLQVAPNKNYIDGTIGGGGHAEAILRATSPKGKLLGLDLDPRAIAAASSKLKQFGARVTLRQENFKQIIKLEKDVRLHDPIHGALLDLGLSSDQLDRSGRGFSFADQGVVDMRFNPASGVSAAELINRSSETELRRIIRDYGEERQWKKIAGSLKQLSAHTRGEFTVEQMVETIENVLPPRITKIHPATKTFQALRIAVNRELDNLTEFLPTIFSFLPVGSRIVIISFHSLEDRLVKNFFRTESKDCICAPQRPVCQCQHRARLKIITKKVIRPQAAEIKSNRRSRSAVLRCAEII